MNTAVPPLVDYPSVNLWDGPAPHSLGSSLDHTPRLYVCLPEKTTRPTPAMIILPGGGYWDWCYQHEGLHMVDWYRQRGVAAFVLFYRRASEGYRHPVPMLDGQRAIRFLRSRAAEWNLDPAKISVIGFSAGGHLASTLATKFDAGDATAAYPVERQSCRPDFAVLVYPVITLRVAGVTNQGSKTNLLGENPDPALVESLSSETQVTPQTPPTVLVHPADDTMVPIENSRLMLTALQKAGVPCELQEYATGGHGFGFGPKQTHAPANWLGRVQEWLEERGFKA